MQGSDVPCELWSGRAAAVLDLILFLGGCPSECKTKEAGWVVFFLKTGDLFPISVELNSVLKLSNFVGATVNTGGGQNSHLSSLRNVWGECKGVAGGVFSPPSKDSSSISHKGIMSRKGSLSLRKIVLLFSLSIPNSSCDLSMLYTFH